MYKREKGYGIENKDEKALLLLEKTVMEKKDYDIISYSCTRGTESTL